MAALWLAWCAASLAATYHVSTSGDDAQPGTQDQPWRTVARSVEVAAAGDTVIVHSGLYDERPTTARGGTGPEARIRFVAEGAVTMKGWRVHHPYVTLQGFDLTGHTSTTPQEAFIRCTASGDNLEVLGCVVRDAAKVAAADVSFVAPNLINIPSGGIAASGLKVGQELYVNRGSATQITNNDGYTIAALTDTQIQVVQNTLVNEGPVAAVLSAAAPYGMVLLSGSENCLVRGCVFRNLAYDAWFIMGSGHVLENNRIEQSNGWDGLHFGGQNHIFRNNILRNSPLLVYQVSPDAWENYSTEPYTNILFTHNVVQGFAGVLGSQKGSNASSGLRIERNVFVDVGRFNLIYPGTVIEHNTFLRAAHQNSPVVSKANHPIALNTAFGATGATIRNNVFVDCGQLVTSGQTETNVGWYEINGPSDGLTIGGNFVTGGPPAYGSKTGWTETNPLLNGGDPGLVNPSDVFGPDGVPFTGDDGLRPRSDSKLIGAGSGGFTPGAYAPSGEQEPVLVLDWITANQLVLSWRETDQIWRIEASDSLAAPWVPESPAATLQGGYWRATLPIEASRRFYRLAR